MTNSLGCKDLLANDKIEDLDIMFKLFHGISDYRLKDMAKIFENYISSEVQKLLKQRVGRIKWKDESHDPEFVKFGNHQYFGISCLVFIDEKVYQFKIR